MQSCSVLHRMVVDKIKIKNNLATTTASHWEAEKNNQTININPITNRAMLSFLAISAVGAIFYSQKRRNSKFSTIFACFLISLPDITMLYTFFDILQQGICITAKFTPAGIAQQLLRQLNECYTVPCSMHWTNPWTFHKWQLKVQCKHNTTNTNTTNQHDLLCLFHLHHVHSIYNGLHIHINKKKQDPKIKCLTVDIYPHVTNLVSFPFPQQSVSTHYITKNKTWHQPHKQ